jgi:ribonuclease R
MAKSRKDKKDKPKKDKEKSPRLDEQRSKAQMVLSAIQNLGKDATLKNLFPKLEKKLSQPDITLALNELDRKGIIQLQSKGEIKLLRRSGGDMGKGETKGAFGAGGKYVIGKADVTQSGAAFIMVDGQDKDVYVPAKFTRNAMQGDEVKVRILTHGRRPEGEIVEILKRSQDSFVGRLDVLEKFAFFIADEKRLNTDVFIPMDLISGAKTNDRVIVRITDWGNGSKKPSGEVIEVLKGAQDANYDMKMILIGNGFSIDFPREVYNELAKVSERISDDEIARRVDFRDVLTFTIDPEDAKDFDDAISIRTLDNGNLEIGVHIADVSHYVREGSALDKEAERRATSVYLPDRVCPMLPEKLSNILCSLRPKEDKLTFSAIFELDDKHNIKNYSIAKTVIHSDRRFTYEEAQQVIESGEGDYVQELHMLNKIAKGLRAKRFKKGAIGFEKPEVRFKLDDTGKPISVYVKERKDAHLLVEDFMLLANETVAKFGSQLHKGKKGPFVYRIHDAPDLTRLEQFSAIASRFGYALKFDDAKEVATTLNNLLKHIEGKPEQNVLETMAIRSMAKAIYTTRNIGHYGLAIEYYTHFTSPIRRYPDVLVHRLLEGILSGHAVPIDKEELEIRCKNSSLMERKAMDAEREATKYKQIEYLQDKVGNTYEGIISGVIARGIFVEISENKCEGMVSVELLGNEDFVYDEKMVRLVGNKTGTKYQIGDKVNIKILSADIILRRVDFGLAE